ncbi:MAG: HVO_0476 family zinc finger protein [Candidatus Poseidoniaceae archaeon]|tara:strand:- start:320 stop:1108 length:789 start_codon:yes stop_codon:yes gene_type:complete
MGKRMDEPEEMEDFYEEEEVFLENAVHCPVCDELTGHEILTEKLKGTGKDYLLKCIDCSKVHTVHLRPPPVVEIPFILTEGPSSSTSKLEIDADEMIELEDVFKDGEKLWKINQIEMKNGRKAKRAEASLIARASALRCDMVRVKITMTRGEDSEADVLIVPEATTYTASKLIEIEGHEWRIRAIHTGKGRTLRGTVDAPDIKRMYLHEPPNPEHFEPRTPRERRQAWKEGRLGFNPNPVLPKEIIKKGVKPESRRKKKPRR